MNQKVQGKKPAGRVTATCTYNGSSYSTGATTCQNGSTFECQSDGSWKEKRISCFNMEDE
ncbi:DUF1496 domain-containing protein [Bacillus wiedmannii]|uniref:DUF1496 domain-containing protein n=1 Tax=Bacillus wiedmannii TaxID=1890302 RepID=UPI000BFE717D|nr:DUF1496 domain-containing protein [Bacillus wiedmannii]PHF09267.1 hypothetical protein COF74_10750 [Bacillus wiedmannii]